MSVQAVRYNGNLDGSDYEILPVRAGQTINQWLDESGLRKLLGQQPTVVELNGDQLYERDYDYVLCVDDHVALKVLAQGPLAAVPLLVWQIAAVTVVALVLQGMTEPDLPVTADQKEGSPLYSTSVKGNRYRPDTKGALLYGTTRIVPDFSQSPFSVFDAEDQQHYYMKFRVCRGKALVDLSTAEFSDTPLSNFSDYQIEQILPGEKSLIVPAQVIISDAVSDIEMEDDFTSAYVVCGVGERVNRLEVDVQAPQLYKQDREDATLRLYTVEIDFQYQEIDDNGDAVGDWLSLGSVSLSNDDRTGVRRTFGFDVGVGRYQVRSRRLTEKNDSTYVQDTVRWIGLKGFEQDDTVSDCTEIALVLRSSDQVGNRALTNFSVVASKILPTWSLEHGWDEGAQTNHFAWALADLCRAEYAGRRADSHYKLNQLAEFAARPDLAKAEFNAYFDTEGVSVWDALEHAGMPGRVKTIDYAGQYWFVRDEQQPLSVQKFTMRNIVADSYRKSSPNFVTESADSVIVKFRDKAANWEWYNDGDGLLCKVPESPGLEPREVTLFGVDDATEAKKLGMWLAAQSAYRRRHPRWQTGNEGRIPFFGSQVSLSHFLLGEEGREQISGDIFEKDVANSELLLSEPVPEGLIDPHIIFRDNMGRPSAAFKVELVGDDRFKIKVLPIDDGGSGIFPDWTQVRTGDSREEDTHFSLGDGPTFLDLVKITKASRSGDKVSLQGYVDDPRVYLLSEDVTPPDVYSPPGKPSLVPVVRNLEVDLVGSVAAPVVLLSWEGDNCDYYEIEISDDGITYRPYGNKVISTSVEIRPEPGHYYFRVHGYNILRGQPAVIDVITADVANSVPPAPTDLALREPFTGPTLKLQWSGATTRHLVSVLVGGVEQYFTVLDAGDEWNYSATLAQEFGVGRSFTVRVFSIGENTIVSTDYAEINVSNPAPAILNNLSVTPVGEFAQIRFDLPTDTDFKGISVWTGDSAGFSIGVGSQVIARSFDPVLSVPIGRDTEKRLVIAAEDEWGASGLNYSGEYAVSGTLITETDISPEAVKSPHVAANQITAVHTFIQQLSAISGDMGELVAGLVKTSASGSAVRVEMDSDGSLPFWIGELAKSGANGHAFYDKDTKTFTFQDPVTGIRLEVQPGGAMPIWLGSGDKLPENSFLNINAATGVMSLRGMQILSDTGEVAFATGTGFSSVDVEWDEINGRPLTLSDLNSGEGSKLSGIASNATRNTGALSHLNNIPNGTYVANGIMNTLHLAGQAVTFKASSYDATERVQNWGRTTATGWKTLDSFYVLTTGSPLEFEVGLDLYPLVTEQYADPDPFYRLEVQLIVNGAVVRKATMPAYFGGDTDNGYEGFDAGDRLSHYQAKSFSASAQPPAGNRLCYIRARMVKASGDTGSCLLYWRYTHMKALETKR